jgi:hypothetical protein
VGFSQQPIITGPDGTFRIERVAPDGPLALRARAGGAPTDGAIVVRPKDQKGKLTLTVDSKFTFRIQGTVADGAGKPIAETTLLLYEAKLPPRWQPGRGLVEHDLGEA